jgi:hypothetical protein
VTLGDVQFPVNTIMSLEDKGEIITNACKIGILINSQLLSQNAYKSRAVSTCGRPSHGHSSRQWSSPPLFYQIFDYVVKIINIGCLPARSTAESSILSFMCISHLASAASINCWLALETSITKEKNYEVQENT